MAGCSKKYPPENWQQSSPLMTNAILPVQSAKTLPVIDFHAHVVEPQVYEKTVNHNVVSGFGARPMNLPEKGSSRWEIFSRMVEPDAQIRDMDRNGVDINVISTSLVSQSTWWAEPRLAAELDRRANEQIARWVQMHPQRFKGTFTLPMQDMDLALAEMDYAVSTLGLRIANVSSNTRGVYLGDPKFRPFWKAIQRLHIPVLIHPHGVSDQHFQKYALWNGVGQPIEETLVMASLIYEGVFDAFPEVTVIIVHGGGYLPHYTGRLDRNVSHHPVSAQNLTRLPSEYLRCFYYDSCVYDPAVLEALVRRVGAKRILLGSDYPFGEDDPVGVIRKNPNLSKEDMENIISKTPAAILNSAP
jgi:aminocarboxymuconate-semialdehyde decarboxylase